MKNEKGTENKISEKIQETYKILLTKDLKQFKETGKTATFDHKYTFEMAISKFPDSEEKQIDLLLAINLALTEGQSITGRWDKCPEDILYKWFDKFDVREVLETELRRFV